MEKTKDKCCTAKLTFAVGFFVALFMEILFISAVVAVCTGINLLALRFFIGQLAGKIRFLETAAGVNTAAERTSTAMPTQPFFSPTTPVDKPAKNAVTEEDTNIFDVTEQTMSSIPSDVKFELEGGDANVPPGFDEKPKK